MEGDSSTSRTPMQNATASGDYLWTNMMVGEVFPVAMTPSTWSVWQDFFGRLTVGDTPSIVNVAGRPYLNYSLTYSFMLKLTRNRERAMSVIKDSIGVPPAGVEIPLFPISWKSVLLRPKGATMQNPALSANSTRLSAPAVSTIAAIRCAG